MSFYGDFLQAVQTKIAGDPNLPEGVDVILKKKIVRDVDNDSLPVVILAPDEEQQSRVMGGEVNVEYPVWIALIDQGDGLMEANLLAHLDVRQVIRNAIDDMSTTNPVGSTEAWNFEIDYNPAYEPGVLDAGYDYTFWKLILTSTEDRI